MTRVTISEKLLVNALLQIAEIYLSSLENLSLRNTITLLRKRLRMSQRVLAKRAKIPTSTLSRLESGKSSPSLATIKKIFKALFCDFAVIPIPRQDLDKIVESQIKHVAEKRIRYLKGTMALELQQPKDDVIKELLAKEEAELKFGNFDIWTDA